MKTAIKKSAVRLRFTLLELLVVISVITLLASLLLPGLQKAKQASQRISCLNNLKQISAGAFVYIDSYDGWTLPATLNTSIVWYRFLNQEQIIPNRRSLNCPSESKSGWTYQSISYGHYYRAYGVDTKLRGGTYPQKMTWINKANNNTNLIYFGDSTPCVYTDSAAIDVSYLLNGYYAYPIIPYNSYPVFLRHNNLACFVFFDGHAGTLPLSGVRDLQYWKPWQIWF